jgi:hypothetical protein
MFRGVERLVIAAGLLDPEVDDYAVTELALRRLIGLMISDLEAHQPNATCNISSRWRIR